MNNRRARPRDERLPTRSRRIGVVLPERMAQRLDGAVDLERGETISDVVRDALARELKERGA